jgi:hypothetical protein
MSAWENPHHRSLLANPRSPLSASAFPQILPAAVPQLADNRSGKYLPGQRGEPKPFVVGGMGSAPGAQVGLVVRVGVD